MKSILKAHTCILVILGTILSFAARATDQIIFSVTADNAVYTANLDGTGTPSVLVSPAVSDVYGPVGMFADFTNSLLYIAGGNYQEIRTAPLSGGASTILANSVVGAEHFDVYVDNANSRYFFTTNNPNGLWVANTNGSGTATQVRTSGTVIGNAHGLEFNPASGIAYIADVANKRITAVNASTGVATQLYSTGTAGPRGLAIDVTAGKIYWSQFSGGGGSGGSGRIYSGNLDGSGSPTLLYSVSSPYLPHGVFIDYANQVLYWAEFQQFVAGSRIMKAGAAGGGTPTVVRNLPGAENLRGIEFGQPIIVEPPSGVPTLSQWGLIIFGLLLLCTGAITVWRRQYTLKPKAA